MIVAVVRLYNRESALHFMADMTHEDILVGPALFELRFFPWVNWRARRGCAREFALALSLCVSCHDLLGFGCCRPFAGVGAPGDFRWIVCGGLVPSFARFVYGCRRPFKDHIRNWAIEGCSCGMLESLPLRRSG